MADESLPTLLTCGICGLIARTPHGPIQCIEALRAALREANTAPAAHCHGCGRALHAEEVHCDDCWDDLIEDETSQNGTAT